MFQVVPFICHYKLTHNAESRTEQLRGKHKKPWFQILHQHWQISKKHSHHMISLSRSSTTWLPISQSHPSFLIFLYTFTIKFQSLQVLELSHALSPLLLVTFLVDFSLYSLIFSSAMMALWLRFAGQLGQWVWLCSPSVMQKRASFKDGQGEVMWSKAFTEDFRWHL